MHDKMQRVLAALRLTAAQMESLHKDAVVFPEPVVMQPGDMKRKFWSQTADSIVGLACQKHRLIFLDTPHVLYEPGEKRQEPAGADPAKHSACYFYADSCESPLLLFDAGMRQVVPFALSKAGEGETAGEGFIQNESNFTYFVKVNLSLVLMALLKKVHVAEVVPSV